jgi:DNA-binding transcriptional LysR family regulator
METDRLKYFCVIAETGSLTAAAEILNVSHSGLSKAMSVLQLELNQQLFRPLGRGLELTAVGKEVYAKSKVVLESLNQLKGTNTPAKSRIRVGMAEIFSLAVSGEIARELGATDFYDVDSGEAETQILDGNIDFAISFVPFPQVDLEYLKIKKIQMGVFYNNQKFKNLALNELPFVVPNSEIRNNPLSLKSRDGWPIELSRNSVFTASSLTAALQIVESGAAAIFIPKFIGNKLHEYETKKSIFSESERDIFIVKKKNIEESKAMKTVAKIIRTKC